MRNTIPSGRSHANRSRSFWSCMSTSAIASPASRRFGIPHSPVTPCSNSAAITTPVVDRGVLLDTPTDGVTARCVSMLAQIDETRPKSAALARAVDYLRRTQMEEGSWYGRWGMNYIYGTWSVLCALNAAGVDPASPELRRAVAWLVRIQNPDGGLGEAGASYKLDYRGYERAPSTASQTACALLGLIAAGERDHPPVNRRVVYPTPTPHR